MRPEPAEDTAGAKIAPVVNIAVGDAKFADIAPNVGFIPKRQGH